MHKLYLIHSSDSMLHYCKVKFFLMYLYGDYFSIWLYKSIYIEIGVILCPTLMNYFESASVTSGGICQDQLVMLVMGTGGRSPCSCTIFVSWLTC